MICAHSALPFHVLVIFYVVWELTKRTQGCHHRRARYERDTVRRVASAWKVHRDDVVGTKALTTRSDL
jgi:hypothetical protein